MLANPYPETNEDSIVNCIYGIYVPKNYKKNDYITQFSGCKKKQLTGCGLSRNIASLKKVLLRLRQKKRVLEKERLLQVLFSASKAGSKHVSFCRYVLRIRIADVYHDR